MEVVHCPAVPSLCRAQVHLLRLVAGLAVIVAGQWCPARGEVAPDHGALVVGGAVLADAVYHGTNDMLAGGGAIQSIENIPGHWVEDTTHLASGFGDSAGQVISAGVGAAAKPILGNSYVMEIGVGLAAAYWFLRE